MSNYYYIPGDGSDEYASTPDSAATSITGDLDLRIRVNLTSEAEFMPILAKADGSGATRSYIFAMNTDTLRLEWWETDGTGRGEDATTTSTLDVLRWYRVTLDVDNGSSQYDVKFYESSDDTDDHSAVSWSQVGSTVTGSTGTSSIRDTTSIVEVGSDRTGGRSRAEGKYHQAVILDGIGGSAAAHFSADDFMIGDSDSDTAASSDTGETWTLHGATSYIAAEGSGAPQDLLLLLGIGR